MSLAEANPQSGMVETFHREGFWGPVPLFSPAECQRIMAHEAGEKPRAMTWMKGRAASDPFYAQLGADPRILNLVRPLLGNDVILWGVDYLRRVPGQTHPWHCDIESCDPAGGYVSVWIGIDNTSAESALNILTRSHLYGSTVQEQAHKRGVGRNETNADMMLGWGREFDAHSELVTPQMTNGDALLFDGRLWHGTHNARSEGTRIAILLQYASPKRPVKLINFKNLTWPLQLLENPRPPVVVVSGQADPAVNHIVPAPR